MPNVSVPRISSRELWWIALLERRLVEPSTLTETHVEAREHPKHEDSGSSFRLLMLHTDWYPVSLLNNELNRPVSRTERVVKQRGDIIIHIKGKIRFYKKKNF